MHSNWELSDIDKFNYLYSFLEGLTLEAISGLKLTATNYPWQGDLVVDNR